MASKLSSAPILKLVALAFGTIAIAFGVNAIANPQSALSFFELEYPNYGSSKQIVDALLQVYGIRDIFMGTAIYAAATYGSKKTLGLLVFATGGVAFGDGYICYMLGKGEWNHWSYAPIAAAVGALLLGVADGA